MTNRTRTFFVPLFLMLFAGTCLAPPAQAQSVDLGADIMSRYVWRGTDFGNSAAIQPGLSYSKEGFTVGAWGAWIRVPLTLLIFALLVFAIGYLMRTATGPLSRARSTT